MFRLLFMSWWLFLLLVAVPFAFTANGPAPIYATIAALVATVVYSFRIRKSI